MPEGKLTARCQIDISISSFLRLGAHVRAVYLDETTGLLSAGDTSGKHFVDWSVNRVAIQLLILTTLPQLDN